MRTLSKICHLILKHKWYDAIDRGEKTVEYRRNTAYWRRRILDCDRVVFHRGYTSTTMTFEMAFKALHEGQIEIHLERRLRG